MPMSATSQARCEDSVPTDNELLRQIADALGANRRSDTERVEQVIIRRVRVLTADSAEQGPNIPLPKGVTTTIRQRRHLFNPTGYVAFSEGALRDTTTRVELADGDSLEVKITNFKQAWFSADTANTDFEMVAEL